jgi:hypothetical protein
MTNQTSHTPQGLILPGLDGSNPLGFLASLGLLRLLDPSTCMKWTPAGGTWIPCLSSCDGQLLDEDSLLDTLDTRLVDDISGHPAKVLGLLHADGDDGRRRILVENFLQSGCGNRVLVDWLCAVTSDFASSSAINQLQTARRDYFLGNLTQVIKNTTTEHLRRAVFRPWDYADPLDKQSLHLDPSEDRRHAHQWNKPSGDPTRKVSGGMLGANRLAIEAIPLFASVPEDDSLHTAGFSGNRSTNTRWTWPIWNVGVGLRLVGSLLATPLLQNEEFTPDDNTMLCDMGVVAAFRTHRILVGKTPNFTPAQRVA